MKAERIFAALLAAALCLLPLAACGGEPESSPTPDPHEGMVYIMRLIRLHPPTAGYYQGIRDAYKRLGFRDDIARVLEPALFRSQARSGFQIR